MQYVSKNGQKKCIAIHYKDIAQLTSHCKPETKKTVR